MVHLFIDMIDYIGGEAGVEGHRLGPHLFSHPDHSALAQTSDIPCSLTVDHTQLPWQAMDYYYYHHHHYYHYCCYFY